MPAAPCHVLTTPISPNCPLNLCVCRDPTAVSDASTQRSIKLTALEDAGGVYHCATRQQLVSPRQLHTPRPHSAASISADMRPNHVPTDIWCKMTNFETGTRVPLLFRAPWMTNAVGVKVKQLAELVDMYPTLSELAMGPGMLPTGVGGEHLGGTSLVPIFKNPDGPGVKTVALSQFPRCWQNNTGFNRHDGAFDTITGLAGR